MRVSLRQLQDYVENKMGVERIKMEAKFEEKLEDQR